VTQPELTNPTDRPYFGLDAIVREVFDEAFNASNKFPKFASEHEGYAVLAEEVDELWDAIKLNQKDPERLQMIRKEAIQVAAMAVRLVHDRCRNRVP